MTDTANTRRVTSETVLSRLRDLGITLPPAAKPAANYVPYRRAGSALYISGQVPVANGKLQYVGKLGAECSVEDGQAAARLCAINILSQVNAACDGHWERVSACIKLGGFVNATPDFDQHPAVIDGASNLMVDILGEVGRHARFAVGAPGLPFDVAVEIDAIFELD